MSVSVERLVREDDGQQKPVALLGLRGAGKSTLGARLAEALKVPFVELDREVEKEYVALVWGLVQAGKRIDLPIGRDPNDRKKMSATARRARSATTRITKALHLPGVTLIHVAIATGRTHQIRVHLSEIGHPIVGDAVYGGVRKRMAGELRPVLSLDRPFLHAFRLMFHHPLEGRKMEFESPLPHDLQSVLDQILPDDYE